MSKRFFYILKGYIVLQCVWMISIYGQTRPLSSEDAIQRLLQGNERYVKDELEYPNQSMIRREAVINTQKPFAVIVGCSDSRVPPEIIFDQGLGDLFIIRVAGNVIGPIELDSIEYAALCLEASVVLVLGHESCGAVSAVVNNQAQVIPSIAKLIKPAVEIAKRDKGDLLENAIKENVELVVNHLKKRKNIRDLIKKNKMKVIGGYYDLNTGKVNILGI
jgi:carbonic anhydrase